MAPGRAELELDLTRPSVAEGRAEGLARGVCRLLDAMGYTPLTELPLASGRRADVVGLDGRGRFALVEIKASAADFKSDTKWPEYLPHCDRFYFAVGNGFPSEILPPGVGLIVADRFGAEVVRPAPLEPMGAGLRRRQTLRFARIAGNRMRARYQPEV